MNATKEEYVLIAKRCPSCESLVMARISKEKDGDMHFSDYRCSKCEWISPNNGQ